MIYQPRATRPMRLAVFGSGSGTTLETLLAANSSLYEIAFLFSDRPCRFQEIAQRASLPRALLSYEEFVQGKERTLKTRIAYDEKIVALLDKSPIDLILLAGYMRLISAPLLNRFSNRIINTHPGDLTQLDAAGRRKYAGAHAVKLALEAKERATRTSVILVEEGMDTGPILVSGPWVAYSPGDSVEAHQQKQKRLSDDPACLAALEWIAEGRLAVGADRSVFFDEKEMPPCGVEL